MATAKGMVLSAAVVIPALAAWRTANAGRLPQERTVWDSVYTSAQAERGQAAYAKECARCHAAELTGADAAPALTGSAFTSAWNGQLLDALHERIQTAMPTDTPGVYSKALVTDVIAFVLKYNGFPAGSAELTHENGALHGVRFVVPKPGSGPR
jgi:mono/diheme cytochrome c family protein